MLATKCSFCQHENTPGARFCAECGSPMHLKVCPNPQCGKVSDVSAERCESCGQPFPRIALVSPDDAVAAAQGGIHEPENAPAAASKDKPRMPAWPLVMMAIVAGGLPLLWANRAQLPTPKTWQVTTPEAPKTGTVAPAPVASIPPPTAPAPAPAPAVPTPVDPASVAATQDTADSATKSPARKSLASKSAKRATRAQRAKKPEPPRPCTEATAALGLCDPQQAEK